MLSADALRAVTEVVSLYRNERAKSVPLEFEVRLTGQGLDSIVRQAARRLNANRSLQHGEWHEVQDFHFAGSGERQRSTYDVEALRVRTSRIAKERLAATDLVDPQTGVCARVALSRERTVPTSTADVSQPTLVRIQQRRRVGFPPWCVDFGVVWEAATLSDAESKQQTETPTCTLELELDADPEYLTRSDEHIASSMMLKFGDLVGSGFFSVAPGKP